MRWRDRAFPEGSRVGWKPEGFYLSIEEWEIPLPHQTPAESVTKRFKLIVREIAIGGVLIVIALGLIAGGFYLVCTSRVDLHNLVWVALIVAGLAPIHIFQTRVLRLWDVQKVGLVSWGFTLVEALIIVELMLLYPLGHGEELEQRYRLQEFVRTTTGGVDLVTRTGKHLPESVVLPGKYIVYYDNRLTYQQRHLPDPDFPMSRLEGVSWEKPDDLGYSDIQGLEQDGVTPRELGIDEEPPFSTVRTIIIASQEFREMRGARPASNASPGQQGNAEPGYADVALRIWVYDVRSRTVLGWKEFDDRGRLIQDLYTWLEHHTVAPAPDNAPSAAATGRDYESAPAALLGSIIR